MEISCTPPWVFLWAQSPTEEVLHTPGPTLSISDRFSHGKTNRGLGLISYFVSKRCLSHSLYLWKYPTTKAVLTVQFLALWLLHSRLPGCHDASIVFQITFLWLLQWDVTPTCNRPPVTWWDTRTPRLVENIFTCPVKKWPLDSGSLVQMRFHYWSCTIRCLMNR